MTLHVEAQQKAQAEMESVLGTGVLPTLADRDRLPYFEAMFTEVYRCYPLAPTGALLLPFSLCFLPECRFKILFDRSSSCLYTGRYT